MSFPTSCSDPRKVQSNNFAEPNPIDSRSEWVWHSQTRGKSKSQVGFISKSWLLILVLLLPRWLMVCWLSRSGERMSIIVLLVRSPWAYNLVGRRSCGSQYRNWILVVHQSGRSYGIGSWLNSTKFNFVLSFGCSICCPYLTLAGVKLKNNARRTAWIC